MTSQIILTDFKELRKLRQKNNNRAVYESIKNNKLQIFKKIINENELNRILEDLDYTFDTFLKKCRNDRDFAIVSSGRISKKSSRQGDKDEQEQIRICNSISEQYGITIKKPSPETRPTKDGSIVTKNEMKQQNIKKTDCLKSFDGKIDSKIMKGWITAKVCFSYGGHQDNVFEELVTLADWWVKYKQDSEEVLVVLIDTDLLEKKNIQFEKYNTFNNIKVFNHIEFQEYIISTYDHHRIG